MRNIVAAYIFACTCFALAINLIALMYILSDNICKVAFGDAIKPLRVVGNLPPVLGGLAFISDSHGEIRRAAAICKV